MSERAGHDGSVNLRPETSSGGRCCGRRCWRLGCGLCRGDSLSSFSVRRRDTMWSFILYSWLEVLGQWKHGNFYPRWAALAHFAYGEPRFMFYPPASWTLGAGLSAIFPWTLASCIYIWIALVAAGVSMFMLARRWLDPERFRPARCHLCIAVLYAVNPYHLVIIYWRSAFAELLASCLVPCCCCRAESCG
jgi:hypothetical protein